MALLADAGARFGVNYLVTPARLPLLETTLLELASLGCPDILLLSYNGGDLSLHLSESESADLARRVSIVQRALPRTRLALDVCWGERMESVPRLFAKSDCGAGREFLVVTSDARVMPCSFHHASFPARTAAEVMQVWRDRDLSAPARLPGCARTPDYGLTG